MLKLRLSRGGTKKRPVYKIVVAESRFARDGRFIEKLGFLNLLLPKEKKERIGLESERIKYWLSQGAQPTTRVARILGENNFIPMPKSGNNPNKAIPKKERNKEAEASKEGLKQRHQKLKPKRKRLNQQQRHQKRKLKRKKLNQQQMHQKQKLKKKKLNQQQKHQKKKLNKE